MRFSVHSCAVWAAVAMMSAACASGNALRTDSLAADRLLQADSLLSAAMEGSGFATIADFYHPEGVLLYPGDATMFGRDTIARFAREKAGERFRLRPFRYETSPDGSLGYLFGSVEMLYMPAPQHGKYISVWEKTGGQWRLLAFIRNGGGPDAGTAAPLKHAENTTCTAQPRAPRYSALNADMQFSEHSARFGAAAAFAEYAAEDGALTRNPNIVEGRAAIGRLFPNDTTATLTWRPVFERVSLDGLLAVTVGDGTLERRGAAGPQESYSKYVSVWRWNCHKNRWEYAVDGGNARRAS